MNMLCLGWRSLRTCGRYPEAVGYGRNQTVCPPTGEGNCPTATWFYIGLAVVAGIAVMNK